MKACTKCGEDKPLDQYERYFHSTQGVYRTRGYCIPCMRKQKREWKQRVKEQKIIQPVVPELEIEVLEPEVELKKCNKCEIDQPLDHFYSQKRGRKTAVMAHCKNCHNKLYANKTRRPKKNQSEIMITNHNKPNTYDSEDIKRDTFTLMHAIGWKFNEDNQIWWKEGVKTSDGIFVNIRKKKKKVIIKPFKYTIEEQKEMHRLRDLGYTYQKIGEIFNTSSTTIINYIKHY